MDREAINQRLMELFYQTMDQSILQYIQSGWTTPVSPAVQQRVSQVVGKPVQAGQTTNGITLPLGGPQTPPATGLFAPNPGATAIDAPQAVSMPTPTPPQVGGPGGPSVAIDAPPSTTMPSPYGGTGGAASGTGYGYEGPPPSSPFGSVIDEFGRPASQNYANTVATNQAQVDRGRGGGGTPNPPPFTPSPTPTPTAPTGGTTVNPLFPGAAGGGSAVQDAGYQAAMGGDQNALDLVLGKLLSNFGVDVTRPGLFTGSLVKSVAPYLETFLRYYGLNGEGAPALDQAKAAAEKFGGMLGTGGTFGQIQDSAKGLLGTAGSLLGGARGTLAQPLNQQGMISDLLGMLTAGDNGIRQQSLQGQLLGSNYDYGQEQLAGSQGSYMDFLKRQAQGGKLPGGDLLAQILAGAR